MHTMAGGRGSPKGFSSIAFYICAVYYSACVCFCRIALFIIIFANDPFLVFVNDLEFMVFQKKKTEIVRAARLGVAVFLLRYIKRAIRNLSSILP